MNLSIYYIVAIAVIGLIAVGFYGLLVLRNLIKVFVALQVMVKGAILALILAGVYNGDVNTGASMALTVIVADTIVAVVGLALATQVRRYFGTLDIKSLSTLRR